MINRLFRGVPTENPAPEAAITSHESLWEAITHLRIRTALTDERVLFIMRWMIPTIIGLQLLILGYLLNYK